MGQVLIRDAPDETIEIYERRARLAGRTLEEELRGLIERHKTLSPTERGSAARAIRARTQGVAPSLTLDELREGLE